MTTATYGPGIDQSQHAKSVSHIIIENMPPLQIQENYPYQCGIHPVSSQKIYLQQGKNSRIG